jgi:hypothetical protein
MILLPSSHLSWKSASLRASAVSLPSVLCDRSSNNFGLAGGAGLDASPRRLALHSDSSRMAP